MNYLKPGKYRHYKGNLYEVIGIALDSETREEMVVYRALYGSKDFGKDVVWVRPLSSFLENIEINGKQLPRYKFVGK